MIEYSAYITDEDYMLAKAYGIPKKTVYERFYIHGWDKERALTEKVRQRLDVKGMLERDYPNYQELIEESGLSYQLVYARIRRGMGFYEALKSKKLTYSESEQKKKKKGRITEEQYAIALKNGICKATVKGRVYGYGWSVEEAITRPIVETKSNKFNKKRS